MSRRTSSALTVLVAVVAALLAPTSSAPAVAAPIQSAPADDTAPNGQIAYATYESCCAYDIWVINPDGTGATNITNTPDASELDPSWSPDGSRISYTRFDDEFDFEADIWVMNADGTEQTRLTTSTDSEFQADWSPDGTQMVYAAYTEGEVISSQADIFVMNSDGTNPVNVTNADTEEIDPAWSPDGDRIAFAGVVVLEDGGYWELVTMNPDGTGQTPLTVAHEPGYEDRGPEWSPDGEMLVWMAQRNESCCGDWDIWAMNEDGSGQTNLTDDGDPYFGPADWYPHWSPDGTEITFESNRDSEFGFFDVYSMPAPPELPPPPPPLEASQEVDAGGRFTRITTSGNTRTPSWGPAPASVTVSLEGAGSGQVRSRDGGIQCGRDCSQGYAVGDRVQLQARPAAGSVFAGWTGDCQGAEPTCRVRADDHLAVVAIFQPAAAG